MSDKKSITLSYETSNIRDDILFHMVEENTKKYLTIEKQHLENNGIKIINIDYENMIINIDIAHKNKASFKNIPYMEYDFVEIEKKKASKYNFETNDNNILKIILSYFKDRKITIGNYKKNVGKKGIIELSCWLCGKHNNKLYMFLDSFNILSHSKTDCIDEKHQKEYSKIKQDLILLIKKSENLHKKYIKWHPEYVYVKYKKSDPFSITLKKHWELLKEYEEKNFDKPEIVGMQVLPVKENIIRLLKHYEIEIKYNVISKTFDIFKFKELLNENLKYYSTEIQDYFEIRKIKVTKEKLNDTLTNIGLDNIYNPIQNYLSKNYTKYIKTLQNCELELKKLTDCIITSSENKFERIKRFLIQSVNLICRDEWKNSGLHAEYILLLQGLQGTGKSTLAKKLIPEIFLHKYFHEGKSVDVNNKDNILKFAKKWYIELGEVGSTFKKSDRDSFKAYCTAQADEVRRPYDKDDTLLVRRHSIIATCNDLDYLQDPSGSRRMICLNDVKVDFTKLENINIDMIYAFIYDLYLSDTAFHYTFEELKDIQKENYNHTYKTDKLLILENHFNLYPENSKGYLLKDIHNHFVKHAVTSELEIFKSKMILKKYLNQYNVKSKYHTSKKTDIYYLEMIYPDKSPL